MRQPHGRGFPYKRRWDSYRLKRYGGQALNSDDKISGGLGVLPQVWGRWGAIRGVRGWRAFIHGTVSLLASMIRDLLDHL